MCRDESGILARQKQVVAAVADKDKSESEKIKQRLRESREKARSQASRTGAVISIISICMIGRDLVKRPGSEWLRKWALVLRVQDFRKKAELELEAKIVNKQLELARFVNSLVRCKAFIRTKAEPAVYFLPATYVFLFIP